MRVTWAGRLESVLLVTCAVTVTAASVYRQVFARTDSEAESRTVSDWRDYAVGHRSGGPEAPVTLVEFADFQCPFCASFDTIVQPVIRRRAPEAAVIYRHYPLSEIHPYAIAAAMASECAADQDRFDAFRAAAFRNQKDIGRRPWETFAEDAGVPNIARFSRCVADSSTMSRVQADIQAATRLRINGTPSVLIGDQLFQGAVTQGVLNHQIDVALRARRGGSWLSRFRSRIFRAPNKGSSR